MHMSIEELKANMSKQAKRDALKYLRSTNQQLGKAAYQINELIDEFQSILGPWKVWLTWQGCANIICQSL